MLHENFKPKNIQVILGVGVTGKKKVIIFLFVIYFAGGFLRLTFCGHYGNNI